MDFLLVTIASLLFPYVFNLSGMNYQSHLGINTSLQKMNSYSIEFTDKDSDYLISKTSLINFNGYGIKPDVFVDYGFSAKTYIWIAPFFGYEPLTNGIQYKIELKSGGAPSTNAFYYNKGPYFGLKLGVNLFKSNQELKGYGSFGLTPYVLFGVVPISYESEAYYESAHEKRYRLFFGGGGKIDIKGPWSMYLQVKVTNFDTEGSGLNHQIMAKEIAYQFGLSYWLRSNETKSKIDKSDNYDKILDIINQGKSETDIESIAPKIGEPKTNLYFPNNEQKTKDMYNVNQQLKKDSKLLEKAQSKKNKELFEYEETSDIDF